MKDTAYSKFLKENTDEIKKWRHDFHKHPELAFEEVRTSETIAALLKSFGFKVTRNIAITGLVGTLKAGNSPKSIGIRAEMDALPMTEQNKFAHRSKHKGKMHACGHDGHMAMALGAAKYLAETKNFDGTVYFIFQPGEERGGGARKMIEDGLFEKFPADEVYAIHNGPSLEGLSFWIQPGPVLASTTRFNITISGKGGHAAAPQHTNDVVLAAAELVMSLQSVISRKKDPRDAAVLSVCTLEAGTSSNIIPEKAVLTGDFRCFSKEVQKQLVKNVETVIDGICKAHSSKGEIEWTEGYPPTINSEKESSYAIEIAEQVVGKEKVCVNSKPVLAAEDFAFMLEEKPGCMVHLGTGMYRGPVHNPRYDFDDKALPVGVEFWIRLVESRLKAK